MHTKAGVIFLLVQALAERFGCLQGQAGVSDGCRASKPSVLSLKGGVEAHLKSGWVLKK